MDYKNVNILLVDDDRVDVLAIKAALEENKIANPVYVASDGIQALDMLRGTNGHERLADPYLILLDLNMPRMNGIEFLHALRDDSILQSSIVFVLTTSNDDRDRISAYKHNIAGYVVKSEVGQDFVNLIRLLQDFRLVVQFPLISSHP
jgi:CheY-like chemotaxis protein